MFCPNCRIESLGSHCVQCGSKVSEVEEQTSTSSAQQSIPVHFEYKTMGVRKKEDRDWRLEVKRKFIQRGQTEKGRKVSSTDLLRGQPVVDRDLDSSAVERSLFEYKLPEGKSRKVVRLTRSTDKTQTMAQKPVIRKPISSGSSKRRHSPKQRIFSLETLQSSSTRPKTTKVELATSGTVGIPHELVLSRILTGIVDCTFSLLIATLFTFSASTVLNFDLMSPESLQLGLILWFCFYFLNSIFFLLLTRQTPGMFLTDLHLVGEEAEEISLDHLLLRVCLFLPTVTTVGGLLWGVFDSRCRCLHDRLSKTCVVPLQKEPESL